MIAEVILACFIFINISSFFVYGFDKYRSMKNGTRISERELHTFSLLGGFLGATLAMTLFRHKVSKISFLVKHISIMFIWIVGFTYLFFRDFFSL
ncbi:DUF1294 domain-containing protein [Sulfurimonas sp. C5]|uniref:DUF1294 domain-containing protein n=1 Tax=Sulfurimonas sp. C5 TaxID=3036947 RepID=UPI00245499E1|nr:DUF1294 domain-containing protein [Sulfurimonas sp. C5]MDH4943454.1 DUF1294 domain-containing protein [Sulfurimonas sp. C5]